MGFKETVMNSLGFQDQTDEDYQYDDEEYQYEDEEPEYEERPQKQRRFSGLGLTRGSDDEEEDYDDGYSVGNSMRIVLLQPNRFEEAQNIASYLLENKVVVFDLQESDVDTAINIVNFVSGAIYALNGSIQKINDRGAIFVAVPPSVSMDNELRMGFGDDDYGLSIADWVNRTHSKSELQG
ncbi:MAG: cell division protein SepF [Peptococcaceae bacterium]|nr:cell division protein SepF [Peptococcaceae bacterium]